MALSSCPKCGKHSFEIDENTPSSSNYVLTFVQCASCGTVVGAMDYHNIGDLLYKVLGKLESLESKVNSIR